MLRNWAAKFNKSLSKRNSSRRMEIKLPIKLTVVPDRNTGSLSIPVEGLSISGETNDFSKTGIGFTVSCIRLREFYLVGEGRVIDAQVTLPNGRVNMKILGTRYEQTGQHLSVNQYKVGAKIVEMSPKHRDIYEEFISGKKETAGSFHLETEEG